MSTKRQHEYETPPDIVTEATPESAKTPTPKAVAKTPEEEVNEKALLEFEQREKGIIKTTPAQPIPSIGILKHKQGTFYLKDADKIDALGKATGFLITTIDKEKVEKKVYLPLDGVETIEIYTFPTLEGYNAWGKQRDHVVEDDAWVSLVVVQRP